MNIVGFTLLLVAYLRVYVLLMASTQLATALEAGRLALRRFTKLVHLLLVCGLRQVLQLFCLVQVHSWTA